MSPEPGVAGASRPHGQGPQAGAGSRRSGGLLVARHRAGFGAIPSFSHVEELGARVLAAARLWGTPSGPHTVPAPESQAARGPGSGARRVANACDYSAVGPAGA